MTPPTLAPGQYLNLLEMERGLAETWSRSIDRNTVSVDLSQVEWLSPLSLCMLYSWAKFISTRSGTVDLRLPRSDTPAGRFLHSTNARSAFSAIDIRISSTGEKYRAPDRRALTAFHAFSSQRLVDEYLDAIRDYERSQLLLHTTELPEVVSSGDLGRTLLKELADNTFIHADPVGCHFSALAMRRATRPRPDHRILSSFEGNSYIELCIGDISAHTIIDTLLPFLPEEYIPRGRIDKIDWTEEERCAFFAFEYDSTSRPERRRQRLLDLLREDGGTIESIATGLYDVAALTRFYGGQIVFRLRTLLGSIDFSERRQEPRLSIQSHISRKPLAPVPGSTILVRIPTEATGKEYVAMPQLAQPLQRESPRAIKMHLAGTQTPRVREDEVDLALLIEKEVIATTRRPLSREVFSGEKKFELVAVILDGLDLSTKAFGALLLVLMRVPRYGLKLIVLVDNAMQVSLAREQWKRLCDLTREQKTLLRHPSFVVAFDSAESVTGFGSEQTQDATSTTTDCFSVPALGLEFSLGEVIAEARRELLASRLSQPPICHSGELYLIERTYYTPVFFEVNRLLDTVQGRRTLVNWVRAVLTGCQPSTALVRVSSLREVVREIVAKMPPEVRPKVLDAELTNVMRLALRTAGPRDQRVLIVLDVLCTGRFLHRFLELVAEPRKVEVLAIVDARPGDTEFLAFTTPDGTVDVRVHSVLRRPIQVLHERPEHLDVRRILIVDPLTHSPTRYALPERTPLDPNVLLERAEHAGALAAGHFHFKERHYTYFFSLRPLFGAIRKEIEDWIQECAHDITAGVGVESTSDVEIYCLDEDTGLAEILDSCLRDLGLPRPSVITRPALVAPPAQFRENVKVAWFLLPAMATGATVRRALEYGSSLGARRVFVSIVTARVEVDRVLFYQSLRRYKASEITISFLSSLPLVAHGESTCPVCALERDLETVRARVGVARPALYSLLDRASKALRRVPARSAALLGVDPLSSAYPGVWLEARARQEFEAADRDHLSRRQLKRWIEGQTEAEALAAAVGREPSARVFSGERQQFIAYERAALARACRQWAASAKREGDHFQRQLRGFMVLTRESLMQELPRLVELSRGDPERFGALLVEAAANPELFSTAIERAAPPLSVDLKEAQRELLDYCRSGPGGHEVQALLRLHDLKWHLTRSAGFGMPLEILDTKAAQTRADSREIRISFQRFILEGLNEADSRLEQIRRSGKLWRRLEACGIGLDEIWREVRTAVRELEESAIERQEAGGALKRHIEVVERLVGRFVDEIDRIAVRPGPALRAAGRLAKGNERVDVPFTVEVDERCPAVAIADRDFEELIFLLLENARRWGIGASSFVRFCFAPVEEVSSQVRLRVSQNWPWVQSEKTEGGLARIRDLLDPYGASLVLDGVAAHSDAEFEIRFFAWPLER